MENENSKYKMKLKDRTYQYSIKMIEFLDNLPKDTSAQIISKLLLRSATSIGANIVEAQASSSKKISLSILIILLNLPMKVYTGLTY